MFKKSLLIFAILAISSVCNASVMEFRLVPPGNKSESDLKTYDTYKYTALIDGTIIDLLTEKKPAFTDSDISSITGTPTLDGKYRINLILTEKGKKNPS